MPGKGNFWQIFCHCCKAKYLLKCQNGKVTFICTGAFFVGLWLWYKYFYDINKLNHDKAITNIALLAPTGRAAKRITETTGKEAKTIHRLLDIGKIDDNKLENIDADFAPIDADVIIVDEMSMVDMFLMNYLLNCIYKGTKLVLVGDVDQLASVGPGSVLKDLIDSDIIDIVKLNFIFTYNLFRTFYSVHCC